MNLRGKNRIHLTETELRKNLQDLGREIAAATSDVPKETPTQKRHRLERFAKDPEAQVRYYLPHLFPDPFHVEARRILSPKVVLATWLYLLNIWPRGWAKSMVADIAFPLVRDLAELSKCVAMIGATDKNATILLLDIQAEYEFNERLHADFGPQKLHGDWAEGEFQTRRGVWYKGMGLGGNVRGLRRGKFRLDTAYMDDCDTAKRARNPMLVEQGYSWVRQDLWGAAGSKGFAFVDSNNLFSENQIQFKLLELFKTLRKSTAWPKDRKLVVSMLKAIDENGNSTWPEVYPLEFLQTQQLLMGHEYGKNYQHDTALVGKHWKDKNMPWVPVFRRDHYDRIVVYCDPAFSPRGDFCAIVVVGRKGNQYHILDCYLRQGEFMEHLEWWYELRNRWAKEFPTVTLVHKWEAQPADIFIQDSKALADEKWGWMPIHFDDRPRKGNKFERILATLPLFNTGRVGFNEAHRHNPDMVLLRSQFAALEEGSTAADDGPDATEGALTDLIDRKGSSNQRSGGMLVHRSESTVF